MFLDPLHGWGYQFWSGIGSGSPIFAVAAGLYMHHQCYVPGCLRPGHVHPDHDHRPVCRRHR